MNAKVVVVLALVLTTLCLSDGECPRRGGPGEALGSGCRPAQSRNSSACARSLSLPAQWGWRQLASLEAPAVSSPKLLLRRGFVTCRERPPDLRLAAERGQAGQLGRNAPRERSGLAREGAEVESRGSQTPARPHPQPLHSRAGLSFQRRMGSEVPLSTVLEVGRCMVRARFAKFASCRDSRL